MAEIKAFKGLRFNTEKAGSISTLCCPPYDIISDSQRQTYLADNPYNIVRLELPKGDTPYETASIILKQWESDGILTLEDQPAIYIYEEEFSAYNEQRSIKGIIVRVKLEEFSKEVVLPHEFTLSKAKEDRLNLMKATNCNFSQIYALYMDGGHNTLQKADIMSKGDPLLTVTDSDGVTHRLWKITNQSDISNIIEDFKDRKLYIADGHHRYETALNYRNYCRDQGISTNDDGNNMQDYQMFYLVDMAHPGLVVFPTHRLIRGLKDYDKNKVLELCGPYFSIEEQKDTSTMEKILEKQYEEGKTAFGFYSGDGIWYLLTLTDENIIPKLLPGVSPATQKLDVTVLHTLILEKIFGIDKENMAKQINLTYIKIFEEAISAVDSSKFQCAFILNPTRVSEIRDVASAGEKMPQKSTYFYPKTITGLVMNKLV